MMHHVSLRRNEFTEQDYVRLADVKLDSNSRQFCDTPFITDLFHKFSLHKSYRYSHFQKREHTFHCTV